MYFPKESYYSCTVGLEYSVTMAPSLLFICILMSSLLIVSPLVIHYNTNADMMIYFLLFCVYVCETKTIYIPVREHIL